MKTLLQHVHKINPSSDVTHLNFKRSNESQLSIAKDSTNSGIDHFVESHFVKSHKVDRKYGG